MLYQNKQNEIFDIPNLKESIEKAENQGLIKLTNKQLEAYSSKPELGSWNGNEWDIDEEAKLQNKIQESKTYLASTAWYVERLNDPSSGKAIPEEVLTKRAEAREEINRCEEALNINVSE